jgi:pyruvate,water dikinase
VIFPLDLIPQDREADIGGKALNLARLLRRGIPVPPAFSVSASAYLEHVSTGSLAKSIDEAIAADPARRKTALERLACEFDSAPLSTQLADQITQAYQGLGAGRVAVRSSSLSEDSVGHSFAGLHDTFLGVIGIDRVLSAIKTCWASLWTERAFEYRVKNGFDHRQARMAVVVQVMISAEAAGVVFTRDPRNGGDDRLIIEAAFGVGEALVSGKVTPDRFLLSRKDLAIIEHSVAEKKLETVVGHDGVHDRPIDTNRSRDSCLTDTDAIRLGELALNVERIFGKPQDIEWAIEDGKIWILQSRPITTLGSEYSVIPEPTPRAVREADRQVWSNLNAGEVLPDVISPITWSFVQKLVPDIFGTIMGKLGLSFSGYPLLGLVAGRAYFNLNTFAGIVKQLPGMNQIGLEKLFGGVAGKSGKFPLAEEDIPDMSFSWPRVLVHLPTFLAWLLKHTTHGGLRFARAMRKFTYRVERLGLSGYSAVDLHRLLSWLMSRHVIQADAIGYGGTGVMYVGQLFAVCRKWLGDADGSIANRLLSGMGKMDSAESGLALWQLAILASQDAKVAAAIRSCQKFADTRKELADLAAGREFLTAWDAFMERHGHHCRAEIDLMNVRWREQPEAVLDMVRAYVDSMGKINPAAMHRQQGIERLKLAEECRRRLRNPLKRWLFGFILRQAQLGSVVRENIKSEAVRVMALGRRILLLLGTKLMERGLLDRADDIFFLQLEEVGPAIDGKDMRTVIQSRRAEFARNQTITPPAVVVGEFDPDRFTPESADSAGRLLAGLAVSPGVATGPARVILRSETQEKVLPGEILVAPFTDPGWTPYFLQASAIVVDLGGMLSHGSIIAREYGIPAVVNVGPATRTIRTGQMLRVDGNRGEVHVLE